MRRTSFTNARRVRVIVSLLAAIAPLSNCSPQRPGPLPANEVVEVAAEPPAAPEALPEILVDVDGLPGRLFGISGATVAKEPLRVSLFELRESPEGPAPFPVLTAHGGPAEASIEILNASANALLHPGAAVALRDGSEASRQRLFVVLGDEEDANRAYGLAELLIVLDPAEGLSIIPGRVFALPVRGSLDGVTLYMRSETMRLSVTVPASTGDLAQPMIFVYDVRPGATGTDPVDVLMVPQN